MKHENVQNKFPEINEPNDLLVQCKRGFVPKDYCRVQRTKPKML